MPFMSRDKGKSSESDPSSSVATASHSPPRTPSRTMAAPLASVPEIGRAVSPKARPPPSAFRAVPTINTVGPKGKGRAEPTIAQLALQQREGRAPWVTDPLETRRGAEMWQTSERVVLVLGQPTRASLAPLLYSANFADTLILVGSVRPIPEIEALNSPSQLLHSTDARTIYPTVQPFTLNNSTSATPASAALSQLFQQGVQLAEAYRLAGGARGTPAIPPRPSSSRSRRNSNSSTASGCNTPDSAPSKWRFASFSRRDSGSPTPSPKGSVLDLSRLTSAGGSGNGSRPPSIFEGSERATARGRFTSLLQNEMPPLDGTPIDAIIHFLPSPPPNVDQAVNMKALLQQSVVLTSAAMPVFTSQVTPNSQVATIPINELAPLSLVHILPVDAPPAVGPVIERFLLPFLPTMAGRVRRDLFGVVTGLGVWMAPQADASGESQPGADTVLFGGVRCPHHLVPEGLRPQAMLAGWDYAVSSPGTLVDAPRSTEPPAAFSRQASSMTLSEIRAAHAGHPVSAPTSTLSSPTTEPTKRFPKATSASNLRGLAMSPTNDTSPKQTHRTASIKAPSIKAPSITSEYSRPLEMETTRKGFLGKLRRSPSNQKLSAFTTPVISAPLRQRLSPEPATGGRTRTPESDKSSPPSPMASSQYSDASSTTAKVPAAAPSPTTSSYTSKFDPRAQSGSSTFTSRFDPRQRSLSPELEPRNNVESLTKRLSGGYPGTVPSLSFSSASDDSHAPNTSNSISHSERSASHGGFTRQPSALRNAVKADTTPRSTPTPTQTVTTSFNSYVTTPTPTVTTSFNTISTSPPTPELDPSSSSCSSSSVLEVPSAEERSVRSTQDRSIKSSRTDQTLSPVTNAKPGLGSFSGRKSFTSLFRRRTMKA